MPNNRKAYKKEGKQEKEEEEWKKIFSGLFRPILLNHADRKRVLRWEQEGKNH